MLDLFSLIMDKYKYRIAYLGLRDRRYNNNLTTCYIIVIESAVDRLWLCN